MKRRFRLTKSTNFQRVRRLGKSYAHPLVVLLALPNQAERSRFGVAAGRALGGAVQRNRAKRLIRAALQPCLAAVPAGWDIVLIARRPLAEASFQQTRAAIVSLLRRAELLREIDDS
ncbi:MAG: ribonuclease P protein component [Anaerolineales bacterium]|nr:ribonuclease P protein component [Anaerolineales bacterium]